MPIIKGCFLTDRERYSRIAEGSYPLLIQQQDAVSFFWQPYGIPFALFAHVVARLRSQAARARKLEAQSKLDGLQKDIERLSSLSVEEVHTEEAQVEDLQQVSAVLPAVRLFPYRC